MASIFTFYDVKQRNVDVEIDLVIDEISIYPITKTEIRTALMKMKNGKAGGKDEITAALLKAYMNTTEGWLVNLFRIFWEQERVPKTWRTGSGMAGNSIHHI